MKKKNSPIFFVVIFMVLATLSCSLFNRAISIDESEEPESPVSVETIYQWANSAKASSEYDNPDYAAHQATGEPDTLDCGDKPTAWASLGDFTQEWLVVHYEIPVTPTEINIYESHTSTQVVRVEVVDTEGIYHEVYTGEPKITDCPYILSISVPEADYVAAGVKITIDQSKLDLPWDEIDAVELIGNSNIASTTERLEPEPDSDFPPTEELNVPPTIETLLELPIANPTQKHGFNLEYSGCDEGRELGTEIEVSVHDDRIDIRLWGTNGKYVLLTLPRNLEDNFSDRLVPFALEGRVPSSAGLYIRSVWWYGESGEISTHYNSDNTLSGEVEFQGVRKNGCEFKVNASFENVVLR